MANITDLTELNAAPASDDVLLVTDISDTTQAASGTSKYVTTANLTGSLATSAALTAHASDTANPHSVTAAQVSALALAGGTLTGNVSIAKNNAILDVGISGFPSITFATKSALAQASSTRLDVGAGFTTTRISSVGSIAPTLTETSTAGMVLEIQARSFGTPADGMGGYVSFSPALTTSGTYTREAARLTYWWINATEATRAGALSLGVNYQSATPNTGIELRAISGGVQLGFFGTTPAAQPAAYSPSNVSADRTYNANATSVDELADVLGTLISDLQSLGLLA